MTNKEDTTENIIDQLKNLGNDTDNDNNEEIQENKTVCRLLNIHLKDFFDDIYIPYKFFRDDNWNISKILYNNEDILFYNRKYITETDESRFFEVYDKYILMLEEIFLPSNKLFIFLKKWTDMRGFKWKSNSVKSYLKSLLTGQSYQCISPLFITNLFCDLCNKYKDNEKCKDRDSYSDMIKKKTEKKLNQLVSEITKEIKIFKRGYNEIVSSYVYEYPYESGDKELYTKAFINCIIMFIIDFADKLINHNVYAIHPIVYEVIGYYVPLDEINTYDPSEHNYKHLYIV